MFLLAKHHHIYIYIYSHIFFESRNMYNFCYKQINFVLQNSESCYTAYFLLAKLSVFEYLFYMFCFSLSIAIYYYINKGYSKFVSNVLTTFRVCNLVSVRVSFIQ